jgi:hypothetical protein
MNQHLKTCLVTHPKMHEIEKKNKKTKQNINKVAHGSRTLLTQPKVICYHG